jgi:hypothetical protein
MPRLRAAPGIPLRPHSGGHEGCKRTSYHYHNGRFQCGQVNVLTAFTYVGPGDGGTVVIPGSHKSNIVHPAFTQTDRVKDWSELGGASSDGIPGAVEVEGRPEMRSFLSMPPVMAPRDASIRESAVTAYIDTARRGTVLDSGTTPRQSCSNG